MTAVKVWAFLALMTPVLAAAPASATMEQQSSNGTSYVSGGIGLDEAAEMQKMRAQYPLRLQFAETGRGAYLAGVAVTIADRQGRTVLDAVSDGPFLYANLPAGTYRLTASSDGRPIVRSVTVPQSGFVDERFYWPPKP